MGKTRFTAELDSETLNKAREILKKDQITLEDTLEDTLEEMLSYIVSHHTAPCFQCGEPNGETLKAMAEAEAGDVITADTMTDLFTQLNEEN